MALNDDIEGDGPFPTAEDPVHNVLADLGTYFRRLADVENPEAPIPDQIGEYKRRRDDEAMRRADDANFADTMGKVRDAAADQARPAADARAIERLAEQARELRAAFKRVEETIHGDERLTAQAKSDAITQARNETNSRLRDLYDQAANVGQSRREGLERRLFGPPPIPNTATASDIIARDASFRDALARAQSAGSVDELAAMLRLAARAGDRIQARAVMVVAFDRAGQGLDGVGMADVLNAYSAAYPDDEAAVDELWALRQDTSPGQLFGLGLLFAGV